MALLCRLTVVALTLVITPGVLAQSADDRELMQFRLTPELLTKVETVAKAFDANVQKNPAIKRRLDAQREIAVLEAKDDLTDAEQKRLDALTEIVGDEPVDLGINGGSLSEMAAQLNKVPAMAAALKTAGLPARDMAKFVVTAVQAALVIGLRGAGTMPPGAGENVKFVLANQVAIERINKLLGAR